MAYSMKLNHPDISADMKEKIDQIISINKSKPGAVITVLRECQNVVGYLPVELMDYIGRGLNIPSSDVFGVASFYALFSMKPKGRNIVKVCLGTACYVKGIREVINRMSSIYDVKEGETTNDRRFSLEAVRCLGACGLAPVMVINKDVYGAVTSDRVSEILDKYS